jgi:hypothetical protein
VKVGRKNGKCNNLETILKERKIESTNELRMQTRAKTGKQGKNISRKIL